MKGYCKEMIKTSPRSTFPSVMNGALQWFVRHAFTNPPFLQSMVMGMISHPPRVSTVRNDLAVDTMMNDVQVMRTITSRADASAND